MPRINQLPAASSVAQTDVLAIDTPDKTYKVPRSILAPAPYIATIPTGQWSGSGSDRYITVTASNVTADALLYPFYDNASAALLNGPVWVIPAAGSFTIHTSSIPSGTVTISVLLAGIMGEAQYQVLADVYSKSQVDSIVSQSTAYAFTEATTLVGITAGMNQIRRAGNTVIFTLRGTVNTEIPAFSNGRIVVPNEYKPRGSTNIVAACRVGDAVKVETWQVMNDGNVRCGDNIPTGALWVSLVYPI